MVSIMTVRNRTLGPRLRVVLEPEIALGPGKANLLEAIEKTGSIAAAGRSLRMSYKRAWTLVETMNRDFGTPLVETTKGGSAHGGAELTPTGKAVLTLYRRMEARAIEATQAELTALRELMLPSAGSA
jgi:molybdate transport system regulatory protein